MRGRLIALALAGVVAAAAWLGTRDWLRGYRTTRGARVIHFTVHSPLARRDLHEILVEPREHSSELLVFLHGRSSKPRSNLHQPFFDELHKLGKRAPVVLLADGGDHSYWHDRGDGAWASSLIREVIPQAVERSRADRHRIAIGGISMGGFGALDIARLYPTRFCAVGAHSPAMWFRGADTPAGAFDDAADFARHDLVRFASERRLYHVPVWIDIGTSDPFYKADVALSHELHVHLRTEPGGHWGWTKRMPRYLRWYAAACG